MNNEQFSYDFEALSNAPNSPELDGRFLGQISTDFALVAEILKEASYQVRSRGFSDFPIFVVAKEPIPVGGLLIARTEMSNEYHYFASYLDDFRNRDLITPHQEPLFKENYKNPDEFCCLFVIEGEFAKFIFIPYPED